MWHSSVLAQAESQIEAVSVDDVDRVVGIGGSDAVELRGQRLGGPRST